MKEIFISISKSIYVCDSYFDKIYDHLKIMNSWKEDPELLAKFPGLSKQFDLDDALIDLLMKGGL